MDWGLLVPHREVISVGGLFNFVTNKTTRVGG